MSPSTATEVSPLLRDTNKQYNKLNDPVSIEEDVDGIISVITTDSASPKSTDSDDDDDILKRRLNGSPLMVLLIG